MVPRGVVVAGGVVARPDCLAPALNPPCTRPVKPIMRGPQIPSGLGAVCVVETRVIQLYHLGVRIEGGCPSHALFLRYL